MKKMLILSLLSSLGATLLITAGCSVDSADSVSRTVPINVEGVYSNPNGAFVSRQSGARVSTMNVRQGGDKLEAVDNNNKIFRGTIGNATANQASFTLNGETTAGNKVTISGTFDVSGGNGTMRGTWIEDGLFGTVYATATGLPDPPPVTDLTLTSPSGNINAVLGVGSNRVFSASGGNGTFSWTRSNSGIGTLSATTGASVTYTASSAGNQTITVTSGDGKTATATFTQTQ